MNRLDNLDGFGGMTEQEIVDMLQDFLEETTLEFEGAGVNKYRDGFLCGIIQSILLIKANMED